MDSKNRLARLLVDGDPSLLTAIFHDNLDLTHVTAPTKEKTESSLSRSAIRRQSTSDSRSRTDEKSPNIAMDNLCVARL
jgi:hypothetical protein